MAFQVENGSGIFQGLVDMGSTLVDSEQAYALRKEYLEAAKMDWRPGTGEIEKKGDGFKVLDGYRRDLARKRANLGDPELVRLPNWFSARVMSGAGALLLGIGLAGIIIDGWVNQKTVDVRVGRID